MMLNGRVDNNNKKMMMIMMMMIMVIKTQLMYKMTRIHITIMKIKIHDE